MFLILSPFAVFAGLMLVAPAIVALFASALVAAGLVCADMLRGRSLKLLQLGAAILFAAVGCYVVLVDRQFSGVAARAAVDTGMLVLALGSLALRFPFTMQYARENVDAEIAARPDFRRANYLLTWVWAAAFVTMLAADLGTLYAPWLPLWSGLAAAFAARNAAICFTQWYASRRRARIAAERALLVPSLLAVDGERA